MRNYALFNILDAKAPQKCPKLIHYAYKLGLENGHGTFLGVSFANFAPHLRAQFFGPIKETFSLRMIWSLQKAI